MESSEALRWSHVIAPTFLGRFFKGANFGAGYRHPPGGVFGGGGGTYLYGTAFFLGRGGGAGLKYCLPSLFTKAIIFLPLTMRSNGLRPFALAAPRLAL